MSRSHHHGGTPDAPTSGWLLGAGHGHDLFNQVFFLGRRRAVYRRLVAESGAAPGERVLDVGCGSGYLSRLVAPAVAPGGSVEGVDPSGEAVDHARRSTRAANCSFRSGVAEALDAPGETYDLVVTSLALHHLPEDLRPQALAEVQRVLRPGGRLLLAEFRPPTGRIGRRLVGALHGPRMAHNPVEELEPMVAAAGLEVSRRGDLWPWVCYLVGTKPA